MEMDIEMGLALYSFGMPGLVSFAIWGKIARVDDLLQNIAILQYLLAKPCARRL